jgi:RNA-directed DNA polymerase
MGTKLEEIAKVAKERPKEVFTSLAHLINEESIIVSHKEMEKGKAAGVDSITKEEYAENLEQNVLGLISRMKKHSYKPQPARRTYIDKPGTDKKRPLGIPAYEDKLVQSALAKILNAIFEQEFLNCSFGFRPKRGCHDALRALDKILKKRPVNYIVDADIRGFFEHVDHKWLMKFVEHRIKDPNIIRLITRFLKAGVMEVGMKHDTPEGTPQGGVISPILANIYLHYVLDLWFEKRVRRQFSGTAFMVRYADDSVFCFEKKEEAEEFYEMLIERLGEFNLEVAKEKTKIVDFGKDDDDGSGTFDFLGFTHYRGKSRNGKLRVKRKTSRKKFKVSLVKCKEWIKLNRHMAKNLLMKKLNQKLSGNFRYYGISDNWQMLSKFRNEVKKVLFKYLNRRSQKRSYNSDKFKLFLEKYPLVEPRIHVNIFKLRNDIGYTV